MSNKQTQNYRMRPLMYIVQPDNKDVHVHMQSFVVKKAPTKAKKAEVVPNQGSDETSKNHVKAETEEQPNKLERRAEQVKESRKQKKSLTQMTVLEKIEFFTSLPKNMPRTLCYIETPTEKYRGVIVSKENNLVTIRSLTHSKPIEIPLEAIKVINLLGF